MSPGLALSWPPAVRWGDSQARTVQDPPPPARAIGLPGARLTVGAGSIDGRLAVLYLANCSTLGAGRTNEPGLNPGIWSEVGFTPI